jgi:hypothetical protein
MFGFRRRDAAELGVRFCDGCGGVTTTAQRAATRREREWARAVGARLPR